MHAYPLTFRDSSNLIRITEHEMPSEPTDILFREIYPTLTEGQLREAQANLRRYLEIVWQIQRERSSDIPTSKIDTSQPSATMEERSNVSFKK